MIFKTFKKLGIKEDPMPEGRRPRAVTPRPRSGQRPRVPDCDDAGTAKRSYPTSEVRGGDERSYPTSEVGVAAGRRYPMPLSLRPGAAGRRKRGR